MTEGNNLNKRPIYTGSFFHRSIFGIGRPTSAGAYRSLLRCLGQGSTTRNVLCTGWAPLKLQMTTNCHTKASDGVAWNTGQYRRYSWTALCLKYIKTVLKSSVLHGQDNVCQSRKPAAYCCVLCIPFVVRIIRTACSCYLFLWEG